MSNFKLTFCYFLTICLLSYEESSSDSVILNYYKESIEIKVCDLGDIEYFDEGRYGSVGKFMVPSRPNVIMAVKVSVVLENISV